MKNKKILIFLLAILSVLGIQKTAAAEYDTEVFLSQYSYQTTVLDYKKNGSSWILTNQLITTVTFYDNPLEEDNLGFLTRIDTTHHIPYQSNPYSWKTITKKFYCKKVDWNYEFPPYSCQETTQIYGQPTTSRYLSEIDREAQWELYAGEKESITFVNAKRTFYPDSNSKTELKQVRSAQVKVNLLVSPPFVGSVYVKWYATKTQYLNTSSPPFKTGTENVLMNTYGPFSAGSMPTITLNMTETDWATTRLEATDLNIKASGTVQN